MQTIIDDKYPVHFVNAWTKNLALCGSGWLQATGIRAKALELAEMLNELCPDSREKSLAVTSLEEAVMANASIARNGG